MSGIDVKRENRLLFFLRQCFPAAPPVFDKDLWVESQACWTLVISSRRRWRERKNPDGVINQGELGADHLEHGFHVHAHVAQRL